MIYLGVLLVFTIVSGIVKSVQKARAATMTVDPALFTPELSRIVRHVSPPIADVGGILTQVIGGMSSATVALTQGKTVFVDVRAAGGLFVRIAATPTTNGTRLVIDGARKVTLKGLAEADDTMQNFEVGLRRRLGEVGYRESTEQKAVADPAVQVAATPPVVAMDAPAAGDHAAPSDHTVVAGSVRAVPAPSPGGEVVVQMDDGSTWVVARPTLIGREPQAGSRDDGFGVLMLADPERSVSRTHVAVGRDNGGLWIQDRSSTNGVLVTEPDGNELKVVAGRTARISSGSRLVLGSRWIVVS